MIDRRNALRHADDDGEQLVVDDAGGRADAGDDDADFAPRNHPDGHERALAAVEPQ